MLRLDSFQGHWLVLDVSSLPSILVAQDGPSLALRQLDAALEFGVEDPVFDMRFLLMVIDGDL